MPITPMRDLKAYLEPDQVDRIIQAAGNIRDVLLVRIAWRTGIRVSELVNLRVEDIDFDVRAILIIVQKMRKRDGRSVERRRMVPIDQGTLEMIRVYLEWRKRFSYKGNLLFPITRNRVNQIYWKLGRKAGITTVGNPALSKRTKVHPHTMRHSFAIHCLKNGMSVERLQLILGHSSPATTSVYLQFSLKDLHDDYDRVWGDGETEAELNN